MPLLPLSSPGCRSLVVGRGRALSEIAICGIEADSSSRWRRIGAQSPRKRSFPLAREAREQRLTRGGQIVHVLGRIEDWQTIEQHGGKSEDEIFFFVFFSLNYRMTL